MRRINKVKIYNNDNEKSKEVLYKLKDILVRNNYQIVEKDPDIVIAIGGDGAFLRMIKSEKYNRNYYYVGINVGSLGFLQEVKVKDLEYFVDCLNKNSYKINKVGVQKTIVVTKDNTSNFYSLNEIVLREKDLNTLHLKVAIKNKFLEKYVGDGLLIATSVGSTAYNLSFGGSIVSDAFHTLQITPIAPLNNNIYRNLLNPIIIPERYKIKLEPIDNKTSLLISIDGENKIFRNIEYVETKVDNERLKFLRFSNYCFWEKVNEKFLTNWY